MASATGTGIAMGLLLTASSLWLPEALADTEADAAFAELENNLLTSDFSLTFDIVSTGPYPAHLEGAASLRGADEVSVEADGQFAGEDVAIRLTARDGKMKGGNGASGFEQSTPGGLRKALILGLTRMGLLHNLAVMSSGAPPDHAGGGVRDWVQVKDLRLATGTIIDGDPALAFHFTIVVSGEDAATAVLWVDAETGLPIKREQVVRFDGGEMRVTEIYSAMTIYPR
jgi:hypothetical protein